MEWLSCRKTLSKAIFFLVQPILPELVKKTDSTDCVDFLDMQSSTITFRRWFCPIYSDKDSEEDEENKKRKKSSLSDRLSLYVFGVFPRLLSV